MTSPTNWTFEAPWRLLLLLGVALLVAVQAWRRGRRTAYETRFTQVELLASVLPRRAAWRRRVPAGLLLAALTLVTTAFAKPSAAVEVPREEATVIVALDASTSMLVEDMTPTRIAAAKAAAKRFVEGLPDTFAVGLVSFNKTATIVDAATTDHAAVENSIDALTLKGGTAIGEAVLAAVRAAKAVPTTPGEKPAPVTIVLLSDGINAGSVAVPDAAREAAAAGYPVTTIAYGSDSPTVKLGDRQVSAPVDAATLADLAHATGGTGYRALTGKQLKQIYADITSRAGTKKESRDLTAGLLGVGLLSALAASAASLIWFRVLP
jgi:Ca-activated chloride channel homolog